MSDHCRGCMSRALRVRELEEERDGLQRELDLRDAKDTWRRNDIVKRVFEAWRTDCNHPRAQLTQSKARKIIARLREAPVMGRSREEDLLMAIKGAAASAYTDESSGVRYDGIETIFANAEKVELNLQRYEASRARAHAGGNLESKLIGEAA